MTQTCAHYSHMMRGHEVPGRTCSGLVASSKTVSLLMALAPLHSALYTSSGVFAMVYVTAQGVTVQRVRSWRQSGVLGK